MDPTTIIALALLFALGAALYSSVGHGGASAYIAAMALFSVAPETMKPTALALNLLVAGFGAWRYWRRDLTNWRLVLAFAVTATPAAFIGGGIHLPALYYKPLVGVLLWLAAARLLWQPRLLAERAVHPPSLWVTLPAGAVSDTASNPSTAPFTFDFFVLAGDADRSRTVDTIDFNILATNFALSGKTFSQGDFDYSGTVDTIDFNLLANRFSQSLAAG